MNLWSILREKLLANGDKTFVEEDNVYCFRAILQEAELLSKKLTYPCYGILCSSELRTAISILACIAADVIAVPLSKRYGDVHCRRIIHQAGLCYLIADEGINGEFVVKQVSEIPFEVPEGEKPVLIMYTSGTTGHPKGAMISQENLLCNLNDISRYFKILPSDRILITRPLYHCAVLTGEFLISILKGLDIVFYSGKFNPFAVCSAIRDKQITVMGGTPTLFYHMVSMEKRLKACKSLRVIVTSGECMTPTVADRIRETFADVYIYNVYGLTEASPRVAYLPPSLFALHATSVGYPLHSLQAKIILDTGEEAPPGMDGELIVKGASIMLGYYGDAEMTAEKIREGWLYTGDIASISEDGLITIKCRKDNLIIKSGMNIYPQEIENEIKQCDGIREAYVYARNDLKGRVLICLLVEAEGVTTDHVAEYCRVHLPLYEVPDVIRIVESIPRNGSGKINRKAEH